NTYIFSSRFSNNATIENGADANSTWGGAAIQFFEDTATGIIEQSHFSENVSAHHGGAIVSVNGITIRETQFSGNSADSRGGALYIRSNNAPTHIDNSTFQNNRTLSSRGGAIYFLQYNSAN